MNEILTRQVKIYCPEHQSIFEIEEKPQIICEIREHALSNNFPRSEYWEFCCDCQIFSPSNFGSGGKVKDVCRHCDRPTARRFLCDECKIVSCESEEDTKGKLFGIGAEGVQPSCPGCQKTFARVQANLHQCRDIEGELMTPQAECPFCRKSTQIKADPPRQVEPISPFVSPTEKSGQSASTQCPNCGHWGFAGRTHCGKCGIQINSPVGGVRPGTSTPRTQLLGSICPNCGTGNPADSIFCNNCGQALKTIPQVEKNNSPVFTPPSTFASQRQTFSAAPSAANYPQHPGPSFERKNPTFAIFIGLFVLFFFGGFVAYVVNSNKKAAPASNSVNKASNNSTQSTTTNMTVATNYSNTSNTSYPNSYNTNYSNTYNANYSTTSNTNYSSSDIGRTGYLMTNLRIRSAPNNSAEIRGTHYQDAKIEVLDVYSFSTQEGYSTWYKVRVLENGCDRKEGNGCGNDWTRDGYKYYGEAETEGWMNAKFIVLD